MTRTKPAEQRRAELLAAGQALFLAKGIAGTSLDEITQRAGVSKGLFYLYFASKEDLVLALQEQFSGEVAARMAAAATAQAEAGQADWAARLDACVTAGFESYRELHDLHEVLFHYGHTARSPGKACGACNHGGQDGRSLPFWFRTRDNRATDRNDCGSLVPSSGGVRDACRRGGSGRKGMGDGGDEAADG